MEEWGMTNSAITFLGSLIALITTVAFWLIGGDFVDVYGLLVSFAFSLLFQLAVWGLIAKTGHHAFSLIASFLALVFLSYIPYSKYLLLVLFFMLVTQSWTGLREVLVRKGRWVLPFAAILFAMAIVGSTERNVGDAFILEKLRQFILNPDTLFHASLASMLKHHDIAGTGMHGLVGVQYHLLSHYLYSRIATIFDLNLAVVYGYTNFIFLAPLLITSWLRLLTAILPTSAALTGLLILLGGPLSDVFGWQFNSHFVSESYLLSLVLLAGGLSLFVPLLRERKLERKAIVLALIYLPLMSMAKISVGFIFLAVSSLFVLALSKTVLWTRIFSVLLLGVAGFAGYVAARTKSIPNLEIKFHWGWFQKLVAGNPSLPYFLLTHFVTYWLLLVTFVYLYRKKRLTYETVVWFLALTGTAFVGFVALNLTLDSSGYYFSNVHTFLAMPLFALLIPALNPTSEELNKSKLKVLPVLFLLLAAAAFYFVKMPRSIKDILAIRNEIRKNRDYQNPYADHFEAILRNGKKDFMVYIPKSDDKFWNARDITHPWSAQQCTNIPFYVSILTGSPAVFGLPVENNQDCYIFFRGYESYKPEDYAASAKRDYTNDEVCTEVQRLGFRGFYRVTKDALEQYPCIK